MNSSSYFLRLKKSSLNSIPPLSPVSLFPLSLSLLFLIYIDTQPQCFSLTTVPQNSSTMEATMAEKSLIWFLLLGFASFTVIQVSGKISPPRTLSNGHYHESVRRLEAFKSSLSSPSPLPLMAVKNSGIYFVTSYGADPTGNSDSTEALLEAIADAARAPSKEFLMQGIHDLGGAQINLEGGNYLISRPLRLPGTGFGNLMIHGGTLRASKNFPGNRYLIDLSPSPNNGSEKSTSTSSSSSYNYEYITLKDLLLDSNYRGGGISVINSLRISIDNCYITHFTTNGILVQGGHETYIRNSFLGQHITAGGDKDEKNFSGTGIKLEGNDNAVTDVVIFSAAIGLMITGEANTISGLHCYNKATAFGGTGIYLKLAGLTQTRIVNSYLDYTSIVAEDPVQLQISSNFFLGDANVVLKSINGVLHGVNVVDNMFCGSDSGVDIVHLDQSKCPFKQIEQVVVGRNMVKGMNLKTTVAKGSTQGNGTSWTVDFSKTLLFPDLIKHVQYSLSFAGNTFPNHALKNVSQNRVVIETSEAVSAKAFVTVDQCHAS